MQMIQNSMRLRKNFRRQSNSEEVKTAERHIFILKYKHRYAVKLMCKVLKISESGYYRWLKNKDKPSKRHLLLVKINEILSEHPDNANYGYDRIHKALEIRGIKVSRNTVYRAMKDGNLIHKARKPHGITKASTVWTVFLRSH